MTRHAAAVTAAGSRRERRITRNRLRFTRPRARRSSFPRRLRGAAFGLTAPVGAERVDGRAIGLEAGFVRDALDELLDPTDRAEHQQVEPLCLAVIARRRVVQVVAADLV